MKSNISSTLGSRLDLRLAAYAAAGTAVAAAAVAPSAQATVVYSGPVSLTVPNNISGIYLNLVTGATGTSGSSVPGYDFNPYGSGGLSFFFTGANAGLSQNGSSYALLSNFDYVGPLSTFITGSTATTMANFRAGETGGYLGIKFLNEATGATDYGWVQLSTTGTTGFPATITGYAFQNDGTAIFAGAVPEPGTNAALAIGALALGAVGVRRWRQGKQVAA